MAKRFWGGLAAGLVLILIAGAGAPERKADEAVKGAWATTSIAYNSKPVPIDPTTGPLVTLFDGRSYLQKVGADIVEEGTYEASPEATPATIDLKPTTGPNAGKQQLGIFEREGQTLKLCLNAPGSTRRPKDFEPSGGQILVVTRQIRP